MALKHPRIRQQRTQRLVRTQDDPNSRLVSHALSLKNRIAFYVPEADRKKVNFILAALYKADRYAYLPELFELFEFNADTLIRFIKIFQGQRLLIPTGEEMACLDRDIRIYLDYRQLPKKHFKTPAERYRHIAERYRVPMDLVKRTYEKMSAFALELGLDL